MTIGASFLTRVLSESSDKKYYIVSKHGDRQSGPYDSADEAETKLDKQIQRARKDKFSDEEMDELKGFKVIKESKIMSEAAAAEDRDGVKDGFNIPLDSQARAMAAKLKLPFAKRLVAFHFMCGVPGRYMNTAESTDAIAGAADMLRKKVAVRRAFTTLYEGLAAAKGFNIPSEDGAVKESLSAAQKKAVLKDFKEWTGGFGPDEVTKGRINTYVKSSMDSKLDAGDVKEYLTSLSEGVDLSEAKAKRGSFIQKLLESVLVELGLPSNLVTTTGPSAVGTGIYKTAETIEQDSGLERSLRVLAQRMGIKSGDAMQPVEEALSEAKEEGWYVENDKNKAVAGPMSETAAKKKCQSLGGDEKGFTVSYVSDYSARRQKEKTNEAVDVGNDPYAQAVTALVSALGIPDDVLQRRRTQIVQALRQRKATLNGRPQIMTLMQRLVDMIAKNTTNTPNKQADDENDTSVRESDSKYSRLRALSEGDSLGMIQKLLKKVNDNGMNALSSSELDAANIDENGSDASMLKTVFMVKMPGIKDFKTTKIRDDEETGISATFTLDGQKYSLTWWPEAGQTSASKG